MGKRKQLQTGDYKRACELTFERQDDGTLDISISSETDEVRRWFGFEILSHERSAIDMNRIKSVGAWLVNHDPDQIVGPVVNPRIDKNKVLRAGIRFDDTEIGQRVRKQVENGSMRGSSINYAVRQFEEIGEGETKMFRGKKLQGPGRIVTRWTPIEFTLTPVPADSSVGVGRKKREVKTMAFRWEVEYEDGAQLRKFSTKKEAQEFMDEHDAEDMALRKIGEPQAETSDPSPKQDVDIDLHQLAREASERAVAIQQAGRIADQEDFARELLENKPDISVEQAQKEIHKRWSAKKAAENFPGPNPEAPTVNYEKRFERLDDDLIVSNLDRRSFTDVDVHCVGGIMPISDWRSIVGNAGGHLQAKITDLLTSQKDEKPKLDWRSVNFKSLEQGLAGVKGIPQVIREPDGQKRAVMSSAFDIIAGSTVIAAVRDGYENLNTVAPKLVTDYNSASEVDTIPGALTDQTMKEVQEGSPYLEAGVTEEYVSIGSRKQGRILSLTREMINRDQTGVFLQIANRLGEKAATAIEKLVINRVSDASTATGTYVWKPNGTGTALYSATAKARTGSGGNLKASNALAAIADLNNARALLAAMTDNEGDRINVRPAQVLVPDALAATAASLLGSEMTPAVENEKNPWGPKGLWQPEIVTSPHMDDLSASTWFLGDFKKQFWRKVVFGLETMSEGRNSAMSFSNDIVMRFRVAFDVEVGAVDYVYVVKNTA